MGRYSKIGIEYVNHNLIAKMDNISNDSLSILNYFPSLIYTIEKPEFLDNLKLVFKTYVDKLKKNQNPEHPIMTDNLLNEESIMDFMLYASATGWNILQSQGYKMDDKYVSYESIWGQQYNKKSQMEQHVHNNGVQLVGFYFLDCPEKSPKIVIHDPRPGKVQINLFETNINDATPASNAINFQPKPGMFFFSNAWLPHSFTRHESNKPFNFIHFNLTVIPNPNFGKEQSTVAEII